MRSSGALFVIPLIALSVAGCGVKGTSSVNGGGKATTPLTALAAVDAQGNCTASFVNAFDNVITQATVAQASLSASATLTPAQLTARLQPLLSACQRVLTNPLPSCKALSGQLPTLVSSQSLSPTCQQAAALAGGSSGPTGANGPSGPTSQPTPPTPPAGASGGSAGVVPRPATPSGASGTPLSAPPSGASGATSSSHVVFQLPQSINLIPAVSAVSLVGVQGNGICSPAFATAYFNLRNQLAAAAGKTLSQSDLQLVHANCQAFFGALASPVVCSARLTGPVETISSSTLQAACAAF